MDIPFERWYAAIAIRRSRRDFEPRPLPHAVFAQIAHLCQVFRPFPGVRSMAFAQSADRVFRGMLGHYGKIKGAPAFVAFIGDLRDPHVYQKTGYLGEGIVLEATSLDLGTCWTGGFFRPDVAASLAGIEEYERVLAVSPVGYAKGKWSVEEKLMTGFGRTHRRRQLPDMITGMEEAIWPAWVRVALEAARRAPSAVNRQPWRFHVDGGGITVSVDTMHDTYRIPKRIDCGIAMLHIEVAALHAGMKGTWRFLDPPGAGLFYIA